MSQDRRAAWLREAALAANAAEPDEAATQHAAMPPSRGRLPTQTAVRIAADVAGIFYRAARKKVGRASSAPPDVGVLPPTLAAAPLGLVAGGAVAYAIRQRRRAAQAREANVQVRRERQATQAVVTTCAYVLAAVEVD